MSQERLNEVIQAKRKLSYELIPTESKLLPTFDVVRHYYQQKPIALGSGSNRRLIDMLIQKLDIERYFNAIVSADDVKEHKPHPETFYAVQNWQKLNRHAASSLKMPILV